LTIEIDIIAIVLMESFGAAFFLSVFIFTKLSRRIGGKMEALQEALRDTSATREKPWEQCYSYKWVLNHSLKSRSPIGLLTRSIGPGFFLMMGIMALSAIVTLTVLIILHSAGYTVFIALIGAAILFETDALEAYSYVRSVQKVALDKLVEEDQSYMKIAKKTFEMAALRFLIVGAIFAVAGPFVVQIFNGVVYGLTMYMNILFQTTETVMNASHVLAIMIVLILPAILLYLPELVGKTLFHRMKVAIVETRKHAKE